MPGLLDGKVAIVTGAAHGIGRGHALELAKQGAAVVVNDLGTTVSGDGSGRDADVVVDIIRSRGGRAIADYGDVGDEDQVEALVDRAWTEYGRVDILVNNAGIVRDRAIWNMPVDRFRPGDARARPRNVAGVPFGRPPMAHERQGLHGYDVRPHHQHGLRCRTPGSLRPIELRDRQVGDRRTDAHPQPGTGKHRGDRQCDRARWPYPSLRVRQG